MFKENIRPYEISLWTLQDDFIKVLKPLELSLIGQIETPKCLIKNDGTQELNFSIPMYYYQDGILVENPVWYDVINGTLIVNLRKLKVIFNKGEEGEEVFEFVITNIVETHTNGQLVCEVTGEGLPFQELGKIGYKISLSSQDFVNEYNEWAENGANKSTEPKNNLNYWCEKIFSKSKWNYKIEMDWSAYDGIINSNLSNSWREENGYRRTDRIYEDEYISSWTLNDSNKLIPEKIESFREKLRLVDLEKSNIYNLTQNLAQIFGVFCKYKYTYDSNYHIKEKYCIFYNNFLAEQDGKIDITYPYDTAKIEREINSEDLVTKMFVVPIEDTTSASGLITIADEKANRSGEDYILNFDYLYSIGTISQEQYAAIPEYEYQMYHLNTELEPLDKQLADFKVDLVTYEARLKQAQNAQALDKQQMQQASTAINSLTNEGSLYYNLDRPYRGVLLPSEGEDTYYIKITQKGINHQGIYPLSEAQTSPLVRGIRLYYAKTTEQGSMGELTSYETYSDNSDEDPIFSKPLEINTDDCGNVYSISGIKLKEDSYSSVYYLTFAYNPSIYYQNIYDTYANKLIDDQATEKTAQAKVTSIKNKIEALEARKEILLEKKAQEIANFENLMGPAIKEGSWQAQNYSDYGTKYTASISTTENSTDGLFLKFKWDGEPFEGELLPYKEFFGDNGNAITQKYYSYVDLSSTYQEGSFISNLNKISFRYKENNTDRYLTVGAGAHYAFLRIEGKINPILLLEETDLNISSGDIGYIDTYQSSGVSFKVIKSAQNVKSFSEVNKSLLFPRIEVNSLLLKTSENDLVIKFAEEVLRNYYDYSVLIRDNKYYITLTSEVVIKNGFFPKTFDIIYTISNATTALFLDSLEVAKTNAIPRVSYSLEVSSMNKKFIHVAYQNLNRIVNINDTELKFENVQGYISQLELNLESPWEDKIVIQNYKTKFEDLFSTIVASSEQMKINSFGYNNAANAFGPNGTLKPSVIQNTLNQVDLMYAFQNGNLTIDEINGIWATSESGVVAIRGGGIFCATEKDSLGNWIWNTGILPSGINASLITSGQIDTNLIKIFAGDNLRLQLNADGLFAYEKNSIGDANLNNYVVHNSEGLFLSKLIYDEDNNSERVNLVEVSWNGLIIRDNSGTPVLFANEKGDLELAGIIKAKEGFIGKWEIKENGLYSSNGRARLISSPPLDNEGNEIKEPYNILQVTGSKNEETGIEHKFMVSDDGTLWCNNVIVSGFIKADSYFGESTGSEINNKLRNISLSADGMRFTFNNKNYDGILTTEPSRRYLFISTNALTKEELTTEEDTETIYQNYSFWYQVADENDKYYDDKWILIPMPESDGEGTFFQWKPEHLTFVIKSDIMKIDEVNPTIPFKDNLPHNSVYFKIEKEGRKRFSDSNTGQVSLGSESYVYSDIIQFFSEKINLGKYISQIDPPSYTFIEDHNLGTDFSDIHTFSVELIGFTREELVADEKTAAYWTVNGGEETYSYYEVAGTSVSAEEMNSSTIISDKEIVINGEVIDNENIEGEIILDGTPSEDNDGISIDLIEKDGKFIATLSISSKKIPVGGNVLLTFHKDAATRICHCFKNTIGADGVNVVLRSTSGMTLTAEDTDTELSVEVFRGVRQVNTPEGEQANDLKYYYVWKKDEVALSTVFTLGYEEIVSEDEFLEITSNPKITEYKVTSTEDGNAFTTEDFFRQNKIYITASDFGSKANYRCDVFIDKSEAIAEYILSNQNGDQSLIIIE